MAIFFKDVSNYQGPAYMPTGPTIVKATEGLTFNDADYTLTRDRCIAAGYPFLPYHFLRAGDIAGQVAHVKSVLGPDTPIMVDFETEFGTWPTMTELKEFITSHGLVTLAYIPEWFWKADEGSADLTWLGNTGLISSNYTTYSDSGPGWMSYGGVTPIVWQFTSTPLDTNAFKGTENQLADLFHYGLKGLAMTTPQEIGDAVRTDIVPWASAAQASRMTALGWSPMQLGSLATYIFEMCLNANTKLDALTTKVDALTTAIAALHTSGPVTLDVTLTGKATPETVSGSSA